MNVGDLDHRVRIERQSTTQDNDYGTKAGTWTPVATVWAQVQDVLPSKSAERDDAGLRIARGRSRVRILYRTDIDATMRVVDIDRGNRILMLVTPPAELGFREFLEFLAETYSSQGSAA